MVRKINTSEKLRTTLPLGDTDSCRLVDGAGDDLPGIFLDDFAGRRLLSTTAPTLSPELKDWAISLAPSITTYWKHLDQQAREAPSLVAGTELTEPFEIHETGVRYLASFQAGYSQGIFLDQRENRIRVRDRCQAGDTVLNTFAYTGTFSVCAALSGATTTTLDLSQPYLDWARENMLLNRIDAQSQHFCRGDTFHWLRRFARQNRRFTGIVLDPPTFSRDHGGKVFRAEKHYGELVSLAAACLAPGGWLLSTTNCRRLPDHGFRRMVAEALPSHVRLESHPMPPDFTGDPYLKTLLVET
ncbi:MAG: class I SAM-dependent methyltransferase [Roseibacillus sp.]|jgi:23S rRNA (cytosine1962-C5)-methyltransferase|nr:hypothetical protein [Roseibacillus sp.]MCP4728874.1 class I SAM-dependent rRNA methyltransferase [Roseibacillus sp.]MDP7106200.1 class I SAM-dependent methyltransferase [Roseibacillus sp.]MDP7307477.1 class I SAM-dependent methyltransferase [Roseibacillus sp.]MDP7656817.1 class I SAM-dependent methyltransferase [Roseibacillus sp.]|tara:strand:+ start:41868 stop:42767 length:900 start_codon:yes stop_codon:yes gene_type:complete